MASLLCTFAVAWGVGASKPHIIFNLVDDNGWAGVGYNNPCRSLSNYEDHALFVHLDGANNIISLQISTPQLWTPWPKTD